MRLSNTAMRLSITFMPLVLLARQSASAAAPLDVVQQALATLPAGSGAAWPGQLTRSLRGAGFHRELSYDLRMQPCGGCGIAGLWRRLASALRLPPQLSGCNSPGGAGAQCQVALVQPLPAVLFADMDQLGNLAAAREGGPGAFSARLFGEPDAERTEVESQPTALLLRIAVRAVSPQQLTDGHAQHVQSAAISQPAAGSLAGTAHQPTADGIAAEVTLPLHARYPAPVWNSSNSDSGGGSSSDTCGGSGSNWWRLNWWQSPVVTTVLPQPLVRARCSNNISGLQEGWHTVQLARGAATAENATWSIPAGHLHHAALVNVVTAIAYALGAAAVLKSVMSGRS